MYISVDILNRGNLTQESDSIMLEGLGEQKKGLCVNPELSNCWKKLPVLTVGEQGRGGATRAQDWEEGRLCWRFEP